MKIRIFAVAFALVSSAASAAHISETISLTSGWNAVYLESTPADSSPEDFFADMPAVQRVGCYESSVYGATEQISSDGTTIAQKPVAFYVWERGKDGATLGTLRGGRCYLIYATNAVSKTFYGVPGLPHVSWQVSAEGFTTIAGISIPKGETVQSLAYFKEGPLGVVAAKQPYSIDGDNPAAQSYTPMMAYRGSPNLAGGMAYAFECEGVAQWPGVVKVSPSNASGDIAFKSETDIQAMSIENAGTTNRTIRVEYVQSELAGETQPPLQVYIPRDDTNAAHWTSFATHDFTLAPGEQRRLAFALEAVAKPSRLRTGQSPSLPNRLFRTAFAHLWEGRAPSRPGFAIASLDRTSLASGVTYAALVKVSDLSGTKMRVRVPVTAALAPESETNAKFPKGLWYGNVTLSQVDRLSDGNAAPAGGTMKMNAIVFVDGDGAAHLMQRVALGTAEEPGEDGSYEKRLWKETENVPSGYSARRVSVMFPDVAHRSVAATSGSFGNLLQFDWTVDANARDNPFRHAWHPDHKTGFAVTNRLALSWHAESGESTYAYDPDETTYGIATWTLGGILGTGDVKMRGTFALKRILPISKIEE